MLLQIFDYVHEIRKQNRIPLPNCGIRLQIADFAYSCGFHNSSFLLYKCPKNCFRIPQTVPGSSNTVADSTILPIFEAILNNTAF